MAVAVVLGGAFGIVPVRSQVLRLDVRRVEAAIPVDDPWDAFWDGVPGQRVALSAQNVAPPFGGGTVPSLLARGVYDAERIYLALEWDDAEVDATANSATAFSDGAALQFPSAEAGGVPPFTIGGPDLPVNIWHWKAVWQADVDAGFATGADRYPDTAVDDFPGGDDPLHQPARVLGNPLSQTDHPSPVENLIAEGFGSLTTATAQDVDGVGAWRDGKWRAVFARDLASPGEGHAVFAAGEDTVVAFAVWDGGEGDRNGQKSIAQFIELRLSESVVGAPIPTGPGDGGGPASPWAWTAAMLVAFGAIALMAERSMRGRRT